MDLDKMTIGEAKELAGLFCNKPSNKYDHFIGKKLFIRTVTYHMLGRCIAARGDLVELEQASWIADSGRFMQFIKEGKMNEVEPVGNVHINMSSVCDMYEWSHELPKDQK
jgi:hypothetical protein